MTRTAVEMKRTWLVQRLEKPKSTSGDNPFSFGGGLRNGGLTPEAMDLLRNIFSFEYMGAAEFEFGAVPKTLQALAQDHKSLVADTRSVPLSKVARHWNDKSTEEPTGNATIYILARREHLAEVKIRVKSMAARDFDLKESTHLPEVLRPNPDADRWRPRTAGWLELDNGFMFFTDAEMWAATCALFAIEVSA